MTGSVRGTVEAVWRQESARIVAGLLRTVHDIGLAEELAQDALVAALEQWPAEGVPDNPAAWLTTVAKRRAIDIPYSRRRLEWHSPCASSPGSRLPRSRGPSWLANP
jgi:predicted RNA polymerase sigma factor